MKVNIIDITTPRILIRPPKMGDEFMLNEAVKESYENLRYTMPWAKGGIPSISESELFVKQAIESWVIQKCEEPYLPLFIFDINNHQFIGSTGYHHYDWSVPYLEIGYWIRDSRMNCGYMTEAVNAISRYAFLVLGVKRIVITCDISNVRSRAIAERLRFTLEETLKCNRLNHETGIVSGTLLFAKYDVNDLPALNAEWK